MKQTCTLSIKRSYTMKTATRFCNTFATLLLVLVSNALAAQDKYEDAIVQIAASINTSLGVTDNHTVLVSSFKRMEGKGCDLDEMITGDFEAALIAKPHTYKLLDRANLTKIAEEHKLQMEGQMDEEQRMKEAGKLLKADVMIFATYRLTGNVLLIRVRAEDIQTSEQIAIVPAKCLPNSILKRLCEEGGGKTSGISKPTNSGATTTSEDQPKVTDSGPCGSQTGTYCFKNNGSAMMIVGSNKLGNGKQLQIAPGQTECFYDLPSGVYDYSASPKYDPTALYGGSSSHSQGRKGNLKIEPCKTQTMALP